MKCTLLILAVLAASVAAVREDDADYLSAKLTPPWVDTTDSPTIELKAPPQPPNPPPPPKDGAIWGTFYPAAPPPPPPPPPPMPFPLAAAAGGGKASGTESTGSTGSPSFLQLLAADLASNPLTRLAPGSTEGFNGHFASADVDPSAGLSLIQAQATTLTAAAALAPDAATATVDGSAGMVASLAAEVAHAARETAAAAVDRAITSASSERDHHITTGSVVEPSRHAAHVPIASLLQSSAVSRAAKHVAQKRAAQRQAEAAATEQLSSLGRAATAHATLSQAMALPRFASSALSAYRSRRAAAASALRSAAHSAELAAAGALRGVGEQALPSAVGVAPTEGSTAETARFAGATASRVLQHAGQLQRFRAQARRAAAEAGASADASVATGSKTGAKAKATTHASTKAGTQAQFLPYFAHNYHSDPMQYPYNPFSMVAPHNYGPTGFGATTAAGPLYANFGYFPPSSQILKGTAGPLGDPDHPGTLKAGASTPDVTDNGDPLDKPPPTGAYNPMAPPFFMRGTGWPFPYYMNPNTAPPAHLNPISAAHYAGRMSNVPVWRDW